MEQASGMTKSSERGMQLHAAADLAAKVAALMCVETYRSCEAQAPDELARAAIAAIETHMSWVFLSARYAYKLKKPVRSEFLDFSTLERRRRFCDEELRLNRRLAPSVYLDVLPLRRLDDGSMKLGGGTGVIVDYVVKMLRLPAARMLDRAIAEHTLAARDVRNIASALAAFYAHAPRAAMSPEAYREKFSAAIEANRLALTAAQYGLPPRRIEAITAAQQRFALSERGELAARAQRVVDAHGDLRPEHIYLGAPVQIIDCLEFTRELRLLDPLDELAFLAMECTRLGAPQLSRALLRMYRKLAADNPDTALIHFYQSHRALVRAKLALWHLDDADVRDPARWRARAALYLDIAEHCSGAAYKDSDAPCKDGGAACKD